MHNLDRVDSLHVITTLGVGGAERQLLSLLTELKSLGHRGVVQPVRPPTTMAPDFEAQGVPVLAPLVSESSGAAARLVRASNRLTRVIRETGPRILHGHLPEAELVCALAKRRTVPLVVTRHTALPYGLDRVGFVSRRLSRIAESRSDQVIAISNYVAHSAVAAHELKQAPLVVPYGVSVRPALPRDDTRHDDPQTPLVIGCAARLVDGKGLDCLVSAISIASARSGRPLRLLIAGSGPMRQPLESLVHDLDLAEQVEFLGHVNDMDAFYADIDVFVLPSESEGLGLVLLEAMSHGVPVIAADNTAMVEVCYEGDTGLLFQTGNSEDLARQILRLASLDARFSLSARAQRRLEHEYALPITARSHLRVYQRLQPANWGARDL